MKKLLYVHHSDSKCGSQRSLQFLVKNVDKTEYDTTVLFFNDSACKQLFEDCGAKTIQDSRIRPFHGSVVSGMTARLFVANRFWTPRNYHLAKKYIREVNPDIIHLNSTCLFQFAKAAKAVNPKIKVVCHIREPLLDNYHGYVLRRMCMKYVDRFVSIDEYDATTVDKKLTKTDVVYNFVDFKTYNSSVKSDVLRKELNIPEGDVIFLYLARFAECNGAIELARACAKINNPHYHFVFVGEQFGGKTKYESAMRDFCKDYDNMYLLPFRSDVANVIASSDVMICPFTQPHFSRSIIEAGAMGVPSIASDIDGVKELVIPDKTGVMFDYKDFDTIIPVIEKLAKDKNLIKELGTNAENYAKENFNAEYNVEKTINVYRRFKI